MRNPMNSPPLSCCGCCCLLSLQLLLFIGSHPVRNKAYIHCSTAAHGAAFPVLSPCRRAI